MSGQSCLACAGPTFSDFDDKRFYATDRALFQHITAASPVFNVDKITTPLLVAQGARDPRVNKAESDQIAQALKQRGVDVQHIVKDNEGHGFANEENRLEFYAAMEAFFGKHLKP